LAYEKNEQIESLFFRRNRFEISTIYLERRILIDEMESDYQARTIGLPNKSAADA
jgi:hypothetical protein